MASNLTVMGNKEILLVAENIAHEKGITAQEVVSAMEEGIKLAAKKKYGHHLEIECRVENRAIIWLLEMDKYIYEKLLVQNM